MKSFNLVFPGQGSQFIGMGKDFFDQFDQSKSNFDIANELLGYSISDICFNGPEDTLNQTQYTQVAIFVTSACVIDALSNFNIPVSAYAGHSLGEITAYYAAGVLDFETALKIVVKRGELMGHAAKHSDGTMAAIIGFDQEKIDSILSTIEGVEIANYNSPVQFVISGTTNSVQKACDALKEAGAKRVVPLPVSGAFHSPLMNSAVAPFTEFLNTCSFSDATTPIILNRLATAQTSAELLKQNLSYQIESSVKWISSIETMAQMTSSFIEVGPGRVLSGLIKKINRELNVQATSTVEALDQIKITVEA